MLKDSWLFPIGESLHLVSVALMAGTIVLEDLRTLGSTHRTVPAFWTSVGFALLAVTSPVLFLANVPRYMSNPAFLVKMLVLLVAVAFHFTLHRRRTRFAAILSIILWSFVVLGGRAIADFDV
jgi:hypothetical protein